MTKHQGSRDTAGPGWDQCSVVAMANPWWKESEPPEDVLLELGKLLWSATNLEGDLHVICRCIGAAHGPWDDCSVSTHAQHGLDKLANRPPGELRSRAEEWLTEARKAFAERNAVVHSTPVVGRLKVVERENGAFDVVDEQPEEDKALLVSFPTKAERSRGGGLRTMELSVDGIRDVRLRMDALGAVSMDLSTDLFSTGWWRPGA